MYLNHFKMKTHPFTEPAPLDMILQDQRIAEALARLDYLATQGTIGLLTGPAGVGKSSILRMFLHSLPANRYQPVYLYLTHVNANALLRLLVMGLNEMPARGREKLLVQILQCADKTEACTLLVIDEAHLLDAESLIDLKLLANAGLKDRAPVKILLCGQEILRNQLRRQCHTDLAQRISVQARLFALSPDQTTSYIDYQMTQAGSSERIFAAEAKSMIYEYSGGIPRKINNAATACLMNAASRNLAVIDETLVNQTMTELHLP
jgi:general secretion pathway protein A